MPKVENINAVSELKQDIENANAMIVTDYRGLKVSDITVLRRRLREINVEYKVAKNTLLTIAAGDAATEEFQKLLEGPTAVAFVRGEDTIAAAKALVDFARESKIMVIRGGMVEGHVYGAEQITALSKIPPKDVLISQMMGSIQAPISNFVGTLQGLMSGLVYTLQAVADQKSA